MSIARVLDPAIPHPLEIERPNGLLTARTLARLGIDGRQCRRAVARGQMVRVKRGAFCARRVWESLNDRERHLLRVFAVAETSTTPVFSHWSAAAIHGLATLRPLPTSVFMAAERAPGGRSEPGIRRFCRGLPTRDIVSFGAIRATSLERTLVDIALLAPFSETVATFDAALRRPAVSGHAIAEQLASCPPARGSRRVHRALEFASPLAENPGESASRVVLQQLGAPTPNLQVEHVLPGGFRYVTDFEWPDHKLIGEFDGQGKYMKDETRPGRDPGQVVYREKRREDRLRIATGATFARWGWDEVNSPGLLRQILMDAGLPLNP